MTEGRIEHPHLLTFFNGAFDLLLGAFSASRNLSNESKGTFREQVTEWRESWHDALPVDDRDLVDFMWNQRSEEVHRWGKGSSARFVERAFRAYQAELDEDGEPTRFSFVPASSQLLVFDAVQSLRLIRSYRAGPSCASSNSSMRS